MRRVRNWLLVLAAAVVGATALSTPAMAATVTPAGDHGHVCQELGKDQKNKAVVCADLVVASLGNGAYIVYGLAQAYCQGLSNTGSYPECANATVWISIEDPYTGEAVLRECGHANGPCSTPRTFFTGITWEVGDGQCHHNVWATIFWYLPDTNTAIQLPGSDAVKRMTTNLSTPHFNIGNGC